MPQSQQNDKRVAEKNLALNHKLCVAAQNNDATEARALLDLGANPRFASVKGLTALMIAADNGAADCVRLLIPLSNLEKKTTDSSWTALQLAAASGRPECARLLVEAGATAGLDKNGSNLFELICLADRVGRSLEAAACVQELKSVIDFAARNKHGLSPLGHGARFATPILVEAAWRETPLDARLSALRRSRQERFWPGHDRFLALFGHQEILQEFAELARDIPTLPSEQNFPATHQVLRRHEDAREIRRAIEEGRKQAEGKARAADSSQTPSGQTSGVSQKAPGRRL